MCALALVLLPERSHIGFIYFSVKQKDVGRITDAIAPWFCHACGAQESKTSLWPKKALLLTDQEALLATSLLPLEALRGELGETLILFFNYFLKIFNLDINPGLANLRCFNFFGKFNFFWKGNRNAQVRCEFHLRILNNAFFLLFYSKVFSIKDVPLK